MTHIIRKVEYITGTTRNVFKENIETDNIERTRQELHQCMKGVTIIFVASRKWYNTIKKGIKYVANKI